MNRRNWLDLSRKLVDRYDLDYTVLAAQVAVGQESLAKWGRGIFSSPAYPDSLYCTPSGANMNVAVAAGQAHDENGQLITLDPGVNALLVSDATNPRKALLVLRYKALGDFPVPKPSDPISTIFLNFIDSYDLIVRLGTPAGSPVYPATVPGDVVLRGFTIPALATLASACTVDFGVAMFAQVAGGLYDAITGSGQSATDATIQKALTRLNGDNKRILVGQSEALTATVNVTKNDISFEFLPGVTVSDGGAGTGLNITGTGCKVMKGRFLNFSVAAIVFGAAANNGLTAFNRYKTCTSEVTDTSSAGPNPAVGSITEA